MKVKFSAVVVLLLLTACSGGGGGSTPAAVPTGSASGTVLDGLILNGTVTAYDYSNGMKGAVLGQATTNTTDGSYSLPLQVESRPILLEITGGYYNEESATSSGTSTVTLDPTDKLTALINYTTGQSLKVALTAYTHLAAGLAAYEIAHGTSVATAINDANHRISTFAGLDIVATMPLEITDIANASASPTPSLEYGFLAAGISQWVYAHAPGGQSLKAPYVSIKFDQTMHDDIAADGLLDGQGVDLNKNVIPLSFGTTAIDPNVYRQGLGAAMLGIASSINNKTGITPTQLLTFAQAYAGDTDPMFNGVAPLPVSSPNITISSPTSDQWVHGTINIAGVAQDYAGLSSVALAIDGNPVTTITTGLNNPTFPIDTTLYAEGAHSLTITVTNVAGLSTTATGAFRIDNTAPTITAAASGTASPCHVSGSVADIMSGVSGSVAAVWAGTSPGSATLATTNNIFALDIPYTQSIYAYSASLQLSVSDVAGNQITHSYTVTFPSSRCTNGVCTPCTIQ